MTFGASAYGYLFPVHQVLLDLRLRVTGFFSFLFFLFLENTALSSMDHRLKHVILLSLDSERVGGRWALSTGTKKLGLVDLEGNF